MAMAWERRAAVHDSDMLSGTSVEEERWRRQRKPDAVCARRRGSNCGTVLGNPRWTGAFPASGDHSWLFCALEAALRRRVTSTYSAI